LKKNLRQVAIIDINDLRGHEKINDQYLSSLKEEIMADQILKKPIAVDRNTNVILDGHHRLAALKELGYTKIAVIFVDYQSPKICVKSVVNAGITGNKLPPKSTKHDIQKSNTWFHISKIEKCVNIPLEKLK